MRARISSRLRVPSPWALLCLAIALALALPFVLNQQGWYEWANYYWLLQHQTETVRQNGLPSYYLNADGMGLFYPQFLFYGGTLWSAASYVALALGPWGSFLAFLFAAGTMAYGGTYWFARQAGIDRRLAHLPALVVITSPYYVSVLYGRGDWAEMIATSAIPLALASALALVRQGRASLRPLALLFVSTAIIAGSHGITLLWGGMFCAAVALILILAFRSEIRKVHARRVGIVVMTACLGILVNAWFLLPGTRYGHQTWAYSIANTRGLYQLDRLSVVLHPGRFVPHDIAATNPDAFMQAPVYPLLWAVLAGVFVAVRRPSSPDRRLVVGIVLLTGTLLALLTVNSAWDHLPAVARTIQFPLRLHFYLIVSTVGLMLVGLRFLNQLPRSRVWLSLLVLAVAAQSTLSIAQAWRAHSYIDHRDVVASRIPFTFKIGQQMTFTTVDGPLLPRPARSVQASASASQAGSATITGRATRATRRYGSNIAFSPFVSVTGEAKIVGRDEHDLAVLQATRTNSSKENWHATVTGRRPWPVNAGIAVSIASAFGVLCTLAYLLKTRRRRENEASRIAR